MSVDVAEKHLEDDDNGPYLFRYRYTVLQEIIYYMIGK